MAKNYNYETKCRRCGLLTAWYFAEVGNVAYGDFLLAITDYIQYPRAYKCNTCNKQTVQDVVSYSTDNF